MILKSHHIEKILKRIIKINSPDIITGSIDGEFLIEEIPSLIY